MRRGRKTLRFQLKQQSLPRLQQQIPPHERFSESSLMNRVSLQQLPFCVERGAGLPGAVSTQQGRGVHKQKNWLKSNKKFKNQLAQKAQLLEPEKALFGFVL